MPLRGLPRAHRPGRSPSGSVRPLLSSLLPPFPPSPPPQPPFVTVLRGGICSACGLNLFTVLLDVRGDLLDAVPNCVLGSQLVVEPSFGCFLLLDLNAQCARLGRVMAPHCGPQVRAVLLDLILH